jgi:hypothetical protein
MKHDSKTDSKVGRLKPTKLDKNGQENLLIPLDRHIDAIHRRAKKAYKGVRLSPIFINSKPFEDIFNGNSAKLIPLSCLKGISKPIV